MKRLTMPNDKGMCMHNGLVCCPDENCADKCLQKRIEKLWEYENAEEQEESKMLDCKLVENYLKEKMRMCKCVDCTDCPFNGYGCDEPNAKLSTKECVDIVQKWSDAHQRKTYLSDFLEKYPNALMDEENGMPEFCPSAIGFHDSKKCSGFLDNCVQCWNQPIEEDKDD